mmetsp:Transcript_6729/g.10816  ORF Transcript_6729/g.10816 Transcript_6729/m.10816 type:complete len:214 (-) Transcript_6729:11-652(-)
MCMATSLMCLTFKEPLLQLRLKQEDMKTWIIGIFFSMDTITYTLCSLSLNFIPERKKNFPRIVAFGTVFFFACMLLSGPVPYLLPDRVGVIAVGILVGGIGGAMINNNCVPALSQILESTLNDEQKEDEDMTMVKNNVSAINTGAFGLGSILGPILGSILQALTSYRWAFTITAILVLIAATTQFYSAFFYKKSSRIRLATQESSKGTTTGFG